MSKFSIFFIALFFFFTSLENVKASSCQDHFRDPQAQSLSATHSLYENSLFLKKTKSAQAKTFAFAGFEGGRLSIPQGEGRLLESHPYFETFYLFHGDVSLQLKGVVWNGNHSLLQLKAGESPVFAYNLEPKKLSMSYVYLRPPDSQISKRGSEGQNIFEYNPSRLIHWEGRPVWAQFHTRGPHWTVGRAVLKAKGDKLPRHYHKEHEVYIIEKGEAEVFSDGYWRKVSPGDIVVIKGEHGIRNIGEGEVRITFIFNHPFENIIYLMSEREE